VSIIIDRTTRLVVQGITGRDGSFHAESMRAYGTNVVAGVTPGKGGQTVHGIPVFDTVGKAKAETGANASVVYVPPPVAADAIWEALDAELDLIVCITEGIPVLEMVPVLAALADRKTRLIGPNCPGLISPGQSKVGILPGQICTPGPAGVVSRSGTLTYEVVAALTANGIGQSTCVGIGGDPLIGSRFVDILALFEADPETRAIAMIGEIGGTDEEAAAEFIRAHVSKPVVSFIAGRTAPPGKRMGHAGAIISGGSGRAEDKVAALRAAGVHVVDIPSEIGPAMARLLR
jgi:succinyl-CoA synthetase alpha subunit